MAKTVGGLADLKSITSEELESMSISELLASRTGAYRAANRIYSRMARQTYKYEDVYEETESGEKKKIGERWESYEYAQSQIEKPATYRPPTQRQIAKYDEAATENLRNKLIANIQQLQGVVNQPLLAPDDWKSRLAGIEEEDRRLRELEENVRIAKDDPNWSIIRDYSKKSGWVDKAVSMGLESADAKKQLDQMDPTSKSFQKFAGLVVDQIAAKQKTTTSYTTPKT